MEKKSAREYNINKKGGTYMSIGNNLRKLRHEKGITQEQLAEIFGVSAQAVSRWENDSAYPDITLLPGLAIFYNTTVDAIVGMDTIRNEETLCQIHTRINELITSNEFDKAISFIRENLKTYPNDSGLLTSLGETLAHMSDISSVNEAISVDERILQNDDVSMKAKCTTTANLIFLYLRVGKADKAKELIRSLPHIWESREMMMPELYDGTDHEKELKKAVKKALAFLSGKIGEISSRKYGNTPKYIQLGFDFETEKDTDSILEQIGSFLKN